MKIETKFDIGDKVFVVHKDYEKSHTQKLCPACKGYPVMTNNLGVRFVCEACGGQGTSSESHEIWRAEGPYEIERILVDWRSQSRRETTYFTKWLNSLTAGPVVNECQVFATRQEAEEEVARHNAEISDGRKDDLDAGSEPKEAEA